MPPTDLNQPRLYTRYTSTLKILQYIGYFLVTAFLVLFLFTVISAQGFSPVFIIVVIQAAIAIGFIYAVTQGLIAIVDLLSRIEANTRDR